MKSCCFPSIFADLSLFHGLADSLFFSIRELLYVLNKNINTQKKSIQHQKYIISLINNHIFVGLCKKNLLLFTTKLLTLNAIKNFQFATQKPERKRKSFSQSLRPVGSQQSLLFFISHIFFSLNVDTEKF